MVTVRRRIVTDGRLRDFAELAAHGPAFYCGGEAVQAGAETPMPVPGAYSASTLERR